VKKYFIIRGKRDLIIRKIKDYYVTFDPIDLQYYKFDEVAAEILYCISKKMKLEKIVQYICDIYEVDTVTCRKAIIDFCEETPIQHLIYSNLILSGIYLEMEPFKNENT